MCASVGVQISRFMRRTLRDRQRSPLSTTGRREGAVLLTRRPMIYLHRIHIRAENMAAFA